MNKNMVGLTVAQMDEFKGAAGSDGWRFVGNQGSNDHNKWRPSYGPGLRSRGDVRFTRPPVANWDEMGIDFRFTPPRPSAQCSVRQLVEMDYVGLELRNTSIVPLPPVLGPAQPFVFKR